MKRRFFNSFAAFLLLTVLCTRGTTTVAEPLVSPWPMFGHDAQHTGQSSLVGAQYADIKWYADIGSISSPVVDQSGATYVIPANNELAAIGPEGAVKWRYNIGGFSGVYSIFGVAVAADNTICAGLIYRSDAWQTKPLILAVDQDGRKKWEFIPDLFWIQGGPSALTIDKDGTIYFTADPYVIAVAANGVQTWSTQVAQPRYAPTIGSNGVLYVTCAHSLLAIDSTDGSQIWQFPMGSQYLNTCPVVGFDGTVYVAGDHLYALHPDGSVKWMNEQVGYITGVSTARDGTIYVGSISGLIAINPDGSVEWVFPGYFQNKPAIGADGTVYAVSSKYSPDECGHYLHTVHSIGRDGIEKWHFDLGRSTYGFVWSDCSIAGDGSVMVGLVGACPSRVYAIGPGYADTIPPAAVADLRVTDTTTDSVTLTWTAPGDDGNTGTAKSYDIRYLPFPISQANWAGALQALGEPTPQPAGATESFVVRGLSPGTTYYFALKTADEAPNWSGLSNVVSGRTVALPDLWVKSVDLVQVVWNPHINDDGRIDLVAGKSTMARVEIGTRNLEVLPQDQLVEVSLDFDVKCVPATRSIRELRDNGRFEFYPGPPTMVGDQTVIARVDPNNRIEEAEEDHNSFSVGIAVKDTTGLYLVYFPVRDLNDRVPAPDRYEATVNRGGEFVLATYPVSHKEFTHDARRDEFPAPDSLTNLAGQTETLIDLWRWGKRETDGKADVTVGVVAAGALGAGALGEGLVGKAFQSLKAVLVEEKYWTAIAHEVGHVYGLWWPWEEYYRPYYPPDGKTADGFWVTRQWEVPDPTYRQNVHCFMGRPDEYFLSDWHRGTVFSWVCRDCYRELSKKFLTNKVDPQVLLVSGILSRDGSVKLAGWYTLTAGIVDESGAEGYSICTIGADGRVIDELRFQVVFEMPGAGGAPTAIDIVPFGFAIPYPGETAGIEIREGDQVLVKVDPRTKLLHDAIDCIPDYGFSDNAGQRRNALHNKISEVEGKISSGDLGGAKNKLEFDVKDKLNKWLRDGYALENPLQVSKQEVIQLVANVVTGLAD